MFDKIRRKWADKYIPYIHASTINSIVKSEIEENTDGLPLVFILGANVKCDKPLILDTVQYKSILMHCNFKGVDDERIIN